MVSREVSDGVREFVSDSVKEVSDGVREVPDGVKEVSDGVRGCQRGVGWCLKRCLILQFVKEVFR